MKFNEAQLSRVLTAHREGRLQRGGKCGGGDMHRCLFQAATTTDTTFDASEAMGVSWSGKFRDHVDWFDRNYDPAWTHDEFLAQLESQGLA